MTKLSFINTKIFWKTIQFLQENKKAILQTESKHCIWNRTSLQDLQNDSLKRKVVEQILHYRKHTDGKCVLENTRSILAIRVPQSLEATHTFISGRISKQIEAYSYHGILFED